MGGFILHISFNCSWALDRVSFLFFLFFFFFVLNKRLRDLNYNKLPCNVRNKLVLEGDLRSLEAIRIPLIKGRGYW
jgi:hypothetical protein